MTVYLVGGAPDGAWHVWPCADAARTHYTVLVGAGRDAELYGLAPDAWARIKAGHPGQDVVEHGR